MALGDPMSEQGPVPYPPGLTTADILAVPPRHREDALQEAWLAHLEGRDPALAAHRYKMQELRHEKRQACESQLVGEDTC